MAVWGTTVGVRVGDGVNVGLGVGVAVGVKVAVGVGLGVAVTTITALFGNAQAMVSMASKNKEMTKRCIAVHFSTLLLGMAALSICQNQLNRAISLAAM